MEKNTLRQKQSNCSLDHSTCLTKLGIPTADNNKAERGLRHILLKRSYSSKSQKGADYMAT